MEDFLSEVKPDAVHKLEASNFKEDIQSVYQQNILNNKILLICPLAT